MKRVLDVVASVAGLVVLSPVMLVIALAIRLTSRGPVFYRAQRAGVGGAPFTMFKFRTMRVQEPGASRITAGADDRVFPVGRTLRRFKLDEIPQLINVVTGDMSLVGPRPEDVGIVKEFYEPWMMETLTVRPGLTSPGSLYGSAIEDEIAGDDPERDYAERILPPKLKLELDYVRTQSFVGDLRLIVRTLTWIVRRPAA